MNTKKPISIVCAGCGSRGWEYLSRMAEVTHRFRIVGLADPVAARRQRIAARVADGVVRQFDRAEELFAEEKMADVAVVSTQDQDHFAHASAAMRQGYDLLLEKPIAPTPDEVEGLLTLAEELGRKVIVCHVLRYTPFYRTVKRLLDEGAVGEIVTVNANEGVVPFHQAHSFVRGKWAQAAASSPMILAKCCHDMDILHWLIGRRCERVSSFGSLQHFRAGQAPAGAAERCFDCSVKDCLYDARKYIDEHRNYLRLIWEGQDGVDEAGVKDWLRGGPWERCVYACDNDVVDHQVVAMEFEGGVTGTFTMTAFDSGRHVEIFGTTGHLRAGYFFGKQAGAEVLVTDHATGTTERIALDAEVAGGHGGGDQGLVDALYDEMQKPAAEMTTSIAVSVASHRMAFAAERSRVEGGVIRLEGE